MQQPQSIPETDLVRQLKDNSAAAYEYLYDHYSAALYGFIKRNISDENLASDLLQDVFVRIYRNMEKFDPARGRLFTWMINITRNLCVDYLRSATNNAAGKSQSIENSVNTINKSDHIETKTDPIGLKKLVEALPENQYEAIELVYFKGFTQEEACRKLDIPLGTLKTRVRLAIGSLRKYFKID